MLLEAAPCGKCGKAFTGKGANSVVCDRCNAPLHLHCAHLTRVPPTYWYCQGCQSHITARGIRCPTEDTLLQRHLLGEGVPQELLGSFREQAATLSFFSGKLHKWVDRQWVHFPSTGQQLLILEELHV